MGPLNSVAHTVSPSHKNAQGSEASLSYCSVRGLRRPLALSLSPSCTGSSCNWSAQVSVPCTASPTQCRHRIRTRKVERRRYRIAARDVCVAHRAGASSKVRLPPQRRPPIGARRSASPTRRAASRVFLRKIGTRKSASHTQPRACACAASLCAGARARVNLEKRRYGIAATEVCVHRTVALCRIACAGQYRPRGSVRSIPCAVYVGSRGSRRFYIWVTRGRFLR